ncbi:MAG: hypothetical protein LBD11_08450 [Candidatus Peribacteria bacterium]|jgi:glutamyl-tRNA reductase|nr:hypothetical protein [Candidatus Peribacteria bacterium]
MTLNTDIRDTKKSIQAWEAFKYDPCRKELQDKLTLLRTDTLNSLLNETNEDDKYKKILIKFINQVINNPENIQSDLKNHLDSLNNQKEEEER